MLLQIFYRAFQFFGFSLLLLAIGLFLGLTILKLKVRAAHRKRLQSSKKYTISFLHPYCNSGGGGEKVLWCMIDALYEQLPNDAFEVVVYTGDIVPASDILKKTKDRFNIDLKQTPKFILLKKRYLIDPATWPFFTIFGQIYGTIRLTIEALSAYPPDMLIDSTGLAFSFWITRFLLPSCKIGAYVHYPYVSHEMVTDIKKKKFNNKARIADSRVLSFAKLIYYKVLIYFYEIMGKKVDFCWANSTWTRDHMAQLWTKWSNNFKILYLNVIMKLLTYFFDK